MFDQILFMINDLYTTIMIVTTVTLVGFGVLYFLSGRITNNSKSVSFLGVFVDLTIKEVLQLCAAALKLIYIFSLIVQIGKLQLVNYLGLAEIIIFNTALLVPALFALKAFFFDTALLSAVFIINSLYSFKDTMGSLVAFYAIMVVVSIFIAIFAYYRFVDEVNYLVTHKKEKAVDEKAD